MDVQLNAAGKRPQSTPNRRLAAAECAALFAAAVLIAATVSVDQWNVAELLVIAAFTVASTLIAVDSGTGRDALSGGFLGVVLAAVLLGGGPAALIGVFAVAVGWLRSRGPRARLRCNVVAFAWFPLLVGLMFHEDVSLVHTGPSALSYYLLVLAAFVVGLLLKAMLVRGSGCIVGGRFGWFAARRRPELRKALSTVFPAQLLAAVLAMGAVYIAFRLAVAGIVLFAIVFVTFEYLICELLKSRRRSDQLQCIATTDELTGLANRRRFAAAIEDGIATARKCGDGFTVMLMDLDRFKEINDLLGHHYGDLLLRRLAPRVIEAVGPGGLVARLGGDEFGVLLAPATSEAATVRDVAARLIRRVSDPFAFDELSLEVAASIGIARYPDDGEDLHTLLRCADVAMYAAKEAHCGYKLYAAEQRCGPAPALRVARQTDQAEPLTASRAQL